MAQDPEAEITVRFRTWFLAGILGFRALFGVPPLVIVVSYHGFDRMDWHVTIGQHGAVDGLLRRGRR